jgi:hypothetical protein
LTRLRYACCSSKQFYCSRCSSGFCPLCRKLPKLELNTGELREDRREREPSKFRTCAACKDFEDSADYEYLFEPRCNYHFCFKCILSDYQKYLLARNEIAKQTGIRPDFPFELPCDCELPEAPVLQYLQKSCFACARKLAGSPSFALSNNLRVMEKCLIGGRYLSSSEKLKLRELNDMVLKCDGCDAPLTELLSSEEALKVCRRCFELNKNQVQILEGRQRR